MDERTLTALKASIEHWEQNMFNLDANRMTASYCALCKMFIAGEEDDSEDFTPCGGCPVMEESGESDCGNTPWVDAVLATKAYQRHKGTYTKAFNAVEAEVDFLKGLLPPLEMS